MRSRRGGAGVGDRIEFFGLGGSRRSRSGGNTATLVGVDPFLPISTSEIGFFGGSRGDLRHLLEGGSRGVRRSRGRGRGRCASSLGGSRSGSRGRSRRGAEVHGFSGGSSRRGGGQVGLGHNGG